jgi:hypothetical protein
MGTESGPTEGVGGRRRWVGHSWDSGVSNGFDPRLDRGSTRIVSQNRAVNDMTTSTAVTAHGAVQASQNGANIASTAQTAASAHAATSAGTTVIPAGNAAARVGAGAVKGSAGPSTSGASGTATGSAHVSGSSSVSAMASKVGVALKGSLFAKSIAVVGLGVAGLVVAAHTGAIPQAQGTLSLVPLWSSGPTLFGHLQAGLSGGGSGGLGINLGL